MLYRVTNLGTSGCSFYQGNSFAILDGETRIWGLGYAAGWFSMGLAPGHSVQDLADWNLIDTQGRTVGPGIYTVTNTLLQPFSSQEEVRPSLPIEITPEPASLSLIMAGMVAVALRLRRP